MDCMVGMHEMEVDEKHKCVAGGERLDTPFYSITTIRPPMASCTPSRVSTP